MHDAPFTRQGSNEKTPRDEVFYSGTAQTVFEPLWFKIKDRDRSTCERLWLFAPRLVPTNNVGTRLYLKYRSATIVARTLARTIFYRKQFNYYVQVIE